MAESEEKGYEIHDRRKVRMDENGEVHTSSESSEEQQAADLEEDLGQYPMPPTDVYNLLRSFISILGINTWQWIGLIKNPTTGELNKDMAQAKIAIDTVAFMVSQLDPKLDANERREIQAMLSDLRMNFVQQSSRE